MAAMYGIRSVLIPCFLLGFFAVGIGANAVRVRRDASDLTLSSHDITFILRTHNVMRSQVASADMQELIWNTDLAAMAQDWASGCVWGRGPTEGGDSHFSTVGQNIFQDLHQETTYMNYPAAIKTWGRESANYTYGAGCGVAGGCDNYTQLVWADTFQVGCGYALCNDFEGHRAARYFVCNYGPGGNVAGEQPYAEGAECSQCYPGQGCNTLYQGHGLCSGTPALNIDLYNDTDAGDAGGATDAGDAGGATDTSPAPTEPPIEQCVCSVEQSGGVKTFDNQNLALGNSQKNMLSVWEGNNKDPCKYELIGSSDQGALNWVSFNVGVHKNAKKFYYSITFGRSSEGSVEVRGQNAPGHVDLPYTFTARDGENDVTVAGSLAAGFTVTSSLCPYRLEYAPRGAGLTMRVGKDKYTTTSAPVGLCKDCNGKKNDDFSLCTSGKKSKNLGAIASSCKA